MKILTVILVADQQSSDWKFIFISMSFLKGKGKKLVFLLHPANAERQNLPEIEHSPQATL